MKPDIPVKNVSNGKERVCGLSSSIPLALTLTHSQRERETTHLPTLPGRSARLEIFIIIIIIICRLFVFVYYIYRVEEPRESRVLRIHIIKLNNA